MNPVQISKGALYIGFVRTIAKPVLAFVFILSLLFSPLAVMAAIGIPQPLEPANNATNIGITDVEFTWEFTDNETVEYMFEIATDENFTSKLPSIYPTEKTYTLSETLLEDTKYYWRVLAFDESTSETSDWSDVFTFTTGSGNTPATTTPATTTPPTQPPASTDGETPSFMDKLKGFVDEVGLPIILAVVFILIIIIVLIFALALRPKKPAGAAVMNQSARGGFMPQSITCPVCGFANTPDKKFCGNCGSGLAPAQTSYSQRMPPAPPAPPAQTASAVCSACGNANPPGSQFCGNCGASLMTQQQRGGWQTRQPGAPPDTCPACGAPVQPGRQFCGNCGSSLQSASEQQVVGSYQTFACPICGATINTGQNPCPGCNTWLDWG